MHRSPPTSALSKLGIGVPLALPVLCRTATQKPARAEPVGTQSLKKSWALDRRGRGPRRSAIPPAGRPTAIIRPPDERHLRLSAAGDSSSKLTESDAGQFGICYSANGLRHGTTAPHEPGNLSEINPIAISTTAQHIYHDRYVFRPGIDTVRVRPPRVPACSAPPPRGLTQQFLSEF